MRKNFEPNNLSDAKKIEVLKRYKITLKTICGTTHESILDTDFDSWDCVANEWEMHNQEDCGHASYENPPV